MLYEKRPYVSGQLYNGWEDYPQLGYEPVEYRDGRFYIDGPSWTEQIVKY